MVFKNIINWIWVWVWFEFEGFKFAVNVCVKYFSTKTLSTKRRLLQRKHFNYSLISKSGKVLYPHKWRPDPQNTFNLETLSSRLLTIVLSFFFHWSNFVAEFQYKCPTNEHGAVQIEHSGGSSGRARGTHRIVLVISGVAARWACWEMSAPPRRRTPALFHPHNPHPPPRVGGYITWRMATPRGLYIVPFQKPLLMWCETLNEILKNPRVTHNLFLEPCKSSWVYITLYTGMLISICLNGSIRKHSIHTYLVKFYIRKT